MTYTLDTFVKDAQVALRTHEGSAGREQVRLLLEKLLANPSFVDEAVGPAAPIGTRKLYEDKDLGFVKSSIDLMKTLSQTGKLDERTSMQYEELIRNTTFTGQKATAEGGGAASDGISVSVVARVMGYDCTKEQLQHIGKIMAKKYTEKYNAPPQKHKQMHDGMVIDVNSYMERDRGMMEMIIKEYMERPLPTQKKNKSIKEFMGCSQPSD